jgi:hypothetical protein
MRRDGRSGDRGPLHPDRHSVVRAASYTGAAPGSYPGNTGFETLAAHSCGSEGNWQTSRAQNSWLARSNRAFRTDPVITDAVVPNAVSTDVLNTRALNTLVSAPRNTPCSQHPCRVV